MGKTVIDFLRDVVNKFPDKVACIDDEEQCTYRQLWDASGIIATNLYGRIKVGQPMPVYMKKSCNTLKLIWGIIRAGGCYCIVDAALPEVRIHDILKVIDATSIICSLQSANKKLPEYIQILTYEELCKQNKPEKVYDNMIYDTLPLYIMFTSGSTGVPKGVVVSHGAVANFISEFVNCFKICEEDIIGNQAPWDFDVSVKDIFTAARTGATIRIISKKYFSFPMDLAKLLVESKVTILTWAVSALCILSSSGVLDKHRPQFIRKVIFSGEVMPIKQLQIWKKRYPDAQFVNVYGPTEVTCNCTYYILNEVEDMQVIPIGQPFYGERVFLLDENNEIISKELPDAIGEICVSGNNLALGYYGNEEETNKHFIQNPNNKCYRDIIYRTGDLAYYNAQGELCYSGRKDFQIKHLGHRIELNEIEGRIEKCDGVIVARCVYTDQKIHAIYSGTVSTTDLDRYLRKKLPSFMIPSKYVQKERMPYNLHGKIDRNALREEIERDV